MEEQKSLCTESVSDSLLCTKSTARQKQRHPSEPCLPPSGRFGRAFTLRAFGLGGFFWIKAMSEKCTEELKLRVTQELMLALAKLANAEDRSVSEYIRTVLSLHAFGHVRRLDQAASMCEGCNASSQGARKNF